MKLKLTYVDRKERVSAKTGKPFTSISIKAEEYNDKFLSGFGNKENESWKVGDTVEVAEVREVVKDDKTYLNFEMPKFNGGPSPEVAQKLETMLFILTKHTLLLEEAVAYIRKFEKTKITGTDIDYPVDDGNGIPF